MGFHEVRFPTNINYSSQGGPGVSTSIIEVASGAEERIARWSGARRRYNVVWNVRTKEALAEVQRFYQLRLGPAYGFRLKDFLDFTTNDDGTSDPTNLDQQIGLGDASETQFQLIKIYDDGVASPLTRNLKKPVTGTVVVALDGTPQGAGWSVDTTTGIITFSSAPGSNVVVTAGCEFDVKVRFGREIDRLLNTTLEQLDRGDIPDIPMVELRDEGSTSDMGWMGGGDEITLTGDTQIGELDGRALDVTPDQNGWTLAMPDPTDLPYGGVYFQLHNRSGSFSFDVGDEGFGSIGNVAAGGDALVWLGKVSSAKTWLAMIV